MTAPARRPEKRETGVHVSLDLEILGRLDDAAARAGMSRSELLRRMVEEWTERVSEQAWVEKRAASALSEERIPWEQAKAELGL